MFYRKDLVTLKCERFPIKQKRSAGMRTPKQWKMSLCDTSAAREFASELFILTMRVGIALTGRREVKWNMY